MKEIEVKISSNEINYDEAVSFMESKVESINNNLSKELLWFLTHNHVFTQGTSAKNNEILNSNIINVIKTNRGGKTTYHGPGQRIKFFRRFILPMRCYSSLCKFVHFLCSNLNFYWFFV